MAEFPLMKKVLIDDKVEHWAYPQHKVGEDSYVETGVDNPLPTGNHVMTEGGVWIPQRGSDDGAANTQLIGSNVEEVIAHNAIAITNTSYVSSGSLDTSNMTNKVFHIANYLDSKLSIIIQIRPSGAGGTEQVNTYYTDVAKEKERIILTEVDIPELSQPIDTLVIQLKANTIPLEGVVSTWIRGFK